jgi:hypothetical protein
MPILTSPSVVVTEKDYSQVIPFQATGEGAIVGMFSHGPILQPVLVTTPDELEAIFGKPTDENAKTWYTAWNFLQYSGNLWVTRAKKEDTMNAVPTPTAGVLKGVWNSGTAYVANDIVIGSDGRYYMATITDADLGDDPTIPLGQGASDNAWALLGIEILNDEDYLLKTPQALAAAGTFIAKQPGNIGNNLQIYVIDEGNYAAFDTDTYMSEGRRIVDYFKTGKPTTTSSMYEKFGDNKKDELHIVVVDRTGLITGVPGRIIEMWEGLSKATDSIDYLGRNIYYPNFVNNFSKWIYWGAHSTQLSSGVNAQNWGLPSTSVALDTYNFKTFTAVESVVFTAGNDGVLTQLELEDALITGYELFSDSAKYSISYLMTVDYSVTVVLYVINSIAEFRKDCIVFVSANDEGVPFTNRTTLVTDLTTYRDTTLNVNSSYAVLDSGYKYQFDGYNQKYRWIPLNGDTAGLCARLDVESESWMSPAGFTRGQIKNVIKLSTTLNQQVRDKLYPKQINAIVSFPGKGTVLFGDRTMQSKTSAFQSIYIRRLFIILEKAIKEAAIYQLFELNNVGTRNRFVGMIEPFLRSVQARDGLAEFKVICDSTNNSDESIARGEFVADIYIKPIYSIQYVVLNFVATKSSVQFNTLQK